MKTITTLSWALVLLASMGAARAADAVSAAASPAGQKLDSGLGELPHYSQWADPTGKAPARGALRAASHQVAGEKQDSGLGELPHYSRWGQRDARVAEQVALVK